MYNMNNAIRDNFSNVNLDQLDKLDTRLAKKETLESRSDVPSVNMTVMPTSMTSAIPSTSADTALHPTNSSSNVDLGVFKDVGVSIINHKLNKDSNKPFTMFRFR